MLALSAKLPWIEELSEARQAVLLNMSFQLGIAGLLSFKNTLLLIRAGDYEAASKGMLQSLWASQTPIRAKRLSEQMRTDIWQYTKGT
jgi:lysozyme